ncbi:MAG: ParA family protein [Armatimonadetes bacterium]|nr:ParA family protein [Armatimonadota bacterium]
MSARIVTFFNNKGGVGKTSLVYHLAWMYADLGVPVIAADLDPQANLTAAFLDEGRLTQLWPDAAHPKTVFGCIEPLKKGVGDVGEPWVEEIDDHLGLLVGDLSLSLFEDELSAMWPKCVDRDERAFRVISAFWRVMQAAAGQRGAEMVLMDVGPNLGAINRAALIASDFMIVPLAPDLFSLQGLRNLGPTVRDWRLGWLERAPRNPEPSLSLPGGRVEPAGYIVLQHSVRLDRPVKAYDQWIARIPGSYRADVLDEPVTGETTLTNDPHCLAQLKPYRSLMAMAHESQKPIFHLKSADGALGAHAKGVQEAGRDFRHLAHAIAERTGAALP